MVVHLAHVALQVADQLVVVALGILRLRVRDQVVRLQAAPVMCVVVRDRWAVGVDGQGLCAVRFARIHF